jgi:ribonuclease PH
VTNCRDDPMPRIDGRTNNELRKVEITRGFLKHPEGSVLIKTGDTHVICTATVEEGVPNWLVGSGHGWVTAEYGMLPRATTERNPRNQTSGRTYEIQRIIGRCLRAAVDMNRLGENTIKIDCDVIQADGGTRTASVTGAYVALCDALSYMVNMGIVTDMPLVGPVAAVSVGLVNSECMLDLTYAEDSTAGVDMNVFMRDNEFVEVQGTGEASTYGRKTLDTLLDLAIEGIGKLMHIQADVLSP